MNKHKQFLFYLLNLALIVGISEGYRHMIRKATEVSYKEGCVDLMYDGGNSVLPDGLDGEYAEGAMYDYCEEKTKQFMERLQSGSQTLW